MSPYGQWQLSIKGLWYLSSPFRYGWKAVLWPAHCTQEDLCSCFKWCVHQGSSPSWCCKFSSPVLVFWTFVASSGFSLHLQQSLGTEGWVLEKFRAQLLTMLKMSLGTCARGSFRAWPHKCGCCVLHLNYGARNLCTGTAPVTLTKDPSQLLILEIA